MNHKEIKSLFRDYVIVIYNYVILNYIQKIPRNVQKVIEHIYDFSNIVHEI